MLIKRMIVRQENTTKTKPQGLTKITDNDYDCDDEFIDDGEHGRFVVSSDDEDNNPYALPTADELEEYYKRFKFVDNE